MNYFYPVYGPGLIVNIPFRWYFVKMKTDNRLTRTNIYTYKIKICPQEHPVGIKFANKSGGNYYALFLIQQQIFEHLNSANLAGQDIGRQLQRGRETGGYYRCNEPSKLCQSTFL